MEIWQILLYIFLYNFYEYLLLKNKFLDIFVIFSNRDFLMEKQIIVKRFLAN